MTTIVQPQTRSVIVEPVVGHVITTAPGPAGPPGLAGTGAAQVYSPSSPSATWTFNHSLGRLPSVAIYVNGKLSLADVAATSTTVTATFAQATSGQMVLT